MTEYSVLVIQIFDLIIILDTISVSEEQFDWINIWIDWKTLKKISLRSGLSSKTGLLECYVKSVSNFCNEEKKTY